jgi:hypothetical protein
MHATKHMCVRRPSAAGAGKTLAGSAGTGVRVAWVECWFFWVWSKWPLIMGAEKGGCLQREVAERPGKSDRRFLSRADWRVDKAGKNNAVCEKATSWAGVADWMVALLACWGTGVAGKSIFQSLVAGERVHDVIIEFDGYLGGGKDCGASRIAQLANGDKWACG